jgi:hypothetical protein
VKSLAGVFESGPKALVPPGPDLFMPELGQV